jgi:hypothetical protein
VPRSDERRIDVAFVKPNCDGGCDGRGGIADESGFLSLTLRSKDDESWSAETERDELIVDGNCDGLSEARFEGVLPTKVVVGGGSCCGRVGEVCCSGEELVNTRPGIDLLNTGFSPSGYVPSVDRLDLLMLSWLVVWIGRGGTTEGRRGDVEDWPAEGCD